MTPVEIHINILESTDWLRGLPAAIGGCLAQPSIRGMGMERSPIIYELADNGGGKTLPLFAVSQPSDGCLFFCPHDVLLMARPGKGVVIRLDYGEDGSEEVCQLSFLQDKKQARVAGFRLVYLLKWQGDGYKKYRVTGNRKICGDNNPYKRPVLLPLVDGERLAVGIVPQSDLHEEEKVNGLAKIVVSG